MGFEIRKKGRFEKVEEFTKRIKDIHEKAETSLRKSQEKMRKYADRKKDKLEEY